MRHIPNTQYIISGSEDKTIKIWNYETYKLVHTLEVQSNAVEKIINIHDTKLIISYSGDECLKIWNIETY